MKRSDTGTRRLAGLPLLLALASCTVEPDDIEVIRVPDLDGRLHAPLSPDGRRCTVLLFIATDCPIANASMPALREIAAAYARERVRFFFVHAEKGCDRETARRHAAEHQLPGTVLLDPEQALVEATGATMTPEVFLLDAEGYLAYRGRIDNWFADLGMKRQVATTHELRDALGAVLSGERPPVERTEPIGCLIELRH